MDPALQRIAAAADRGEDVPQLRLLTSSATIYGTPVGSAAAIELMADDLRQAFAKSNKPKRRDRAAVERQYAALADAQLMPFRSEDSESLPNALSIRAPTVVLISTGETFETPLIRVPIASVSAWFVGTFKVWKLTQARIGALVPEVEPPDDLASRADLIS